MTPDEERAYEREVWEAEVRRAEGLCMRAHQTPSGGRRDNEAVDAYLERIAGYVQKAVDHWRYARRKLAELEGRDE